MTPTTTNVGYIAVKCFVHDTVNCSVCRVAPSSEPSGNPSPSVSPQCNCDDANRHPHDMPCNPENAAGKP